MSKSFMKSSYSIFIFKIFFNPKINQILISQLRLSRYKITNKVHGSTAVNDWRYKY